MALTKARQWGSAQALAEAVLAGDRSAIARALTLIDDRRDVARVPARDLLGALGRLGKHLHAHVVGVTGPPGAGKSTLSAALIKHWRELDKRVAVVAVDPSSPKAGGALLGDRLRMHDACIDDHVFIRSLSDRGTFGGLAPQVLPMVSVLAPTFDVVLVETVGVGQREVDIAAMADTTCLVLHPNAGDAVQMLKAGIMEIPDLVVINKSDLGDSAERAKHELTTALAHHAHMKVLSVSAVMNSGVSELIQDLSAHRERLIESDELASRRARAENTWLLRQCERAFGDFGVKQLGGARSVAGFAPDSASIFERLDQLQTAFHSNLGGAQRHPPGKLPSPQH